MEKWQGPPPSAGAINTLSPPIPLHVPPLLPSLKTLLFGWWPWSLQGEWDISLCVPPGYLSTRQTLRMGPGGSADRRGLAEGNIT